MTVLESPCLSCCHGCWCALLSGRVHETSARFLRPLARICKTILARGAAGRLSLVVFAFFYLVLSRPDSKSSSSVFRLLFVRSVSSPFLVVLVCDFPLAFFM